MMLRQIARLLLCLSACVVMMVAGLALSAVIASLMGWPHIQSTPPLEHMQNGLLIWRLFLYGVMAWFWADLLKRSLSEQRIRIARFGGFTLLVIVAIECSKL